MEALRNSILGPRKSDESGKSVLKKDGPSSSPPTTGSNPSNPKTKSQNSLSLPSTTPTNNNAKQQPQPLTTEAGAGVGAQTRVQKANSTGSTTTKSTTTRSILKSPSNASDRSSVKSTASSSGKSVAIAVLALENDDPLPTDPVALEGRLNHHTSQLQQLADRVERINEWIDMDAIVLQRLIRDSEVVAEAQADLQAVTTTLPPSSTTNGTKPNSSTTSTNTPAIHEARDRIATMRRWKKDLERSVVWQREEYRRVERAMGRSGGVKSRFRITNADMGILIGEEGEGKGEDNGGASGKSTESTTPGEEMGAVTVVGAYARGRWSVGGGQGGLPSQGQWEEMFGNGGGVGGGGK